MDKNTRKSTKAAAPKGEKANQIMEDIVGKLIAAIESGEAGKWQMPWKKLGLGGLPRNPVSKVTYQGGNIVTLWITGEDKGYATSLWATYDQWESVGAQVRKGEKNTTCLRWVSKPEERDEAGNLIKKSAGFYVPFRLFNIAQVDNAPAEFVTPVEVTEFERIEAADRFFGAVPADIRHGGDQACFVPALDQIRMPNPEQFVSQEAYYGTLAHELGHWTGHKDRLGREFGKRFGDDAYAAEELVAELSAAFTCATVGIDTVERTDHASYLAHWCSMLKADPGKLWTVASKASAATAHLAAYSEALVAA